MNADMWLEVIVAEGDRLIDTDPAQLAAPVPTCPGWTVHDVIGHTGAVHRWAADKVCQTGLYRGYDTIAFPDDATVIDWYCDGRDLLVRELRQRDPDAPAKTFVGERTNAWWCRRQANEVAVHRFDLDSATRAGDERPIEAGVAAAAVDEWLELFAPRFVEMGPGVPEHLLGRTLHLHAHDHTDGEWVLTVTPRGFHVTRGHVKADAALRGSASDLLLALWHRRALKELDVAGEGSVADEILDLVHVT